MNATFTHGYALLVGVGATAHAPWSLPMTVRDVNALKRALIDPNLCAYPGDHVRTLTDGATTREGILAGLAWLGARVADDPKATALVYYSGHGWVDVTTGAYYLVPHDGRPEDKTGSLLPATTFTEALRAITPERLLVFMDCCHAAGMASAKAPGAEVAAQAPRGFTGAAFPKDLAGDLARGRGRAVFASSRGEQPSWSLPGGKLSLYTYFLLEALQGGDNQSGDRVVTVANLMHHLGSTVDETARQLYKEPQTPIFKFETEDFPVAVLRGGKGLPAGGWPQVKDEARATIETLIEGPVTLAGPGAVVAQEIRAPVATGGSIAAGGNVTIVHGNDNVVGNGNVVSSGPGITARTIIADNVVEGVLVQGGSPEMAARLVQLARAIGRGSITADEIKAGNVVSGVQFIAGRPPDNQEELRAEVAALRAQVQRALAAREIADAGDAEDVEEALATAEAELEKPEPHGRRAARKLKEAAEILTGAAEAATAVGKVGQAVIRLAPVAMMLWKLVEAMV